MVDKQIELSYYTQCTIHLYIHSLWLKMYSFRLLLVVTNKLVTLLTVMHIQHYDKISRHVHIMCLLTMSNIQCYIHGSVCCFLGHGDDPLMIILLGGV